MKLRNSILKKGLLSAVVVAFGLVVGGSAMAGEALAPLPKPKFNKAQAALGKILFWDNRLLGDGSKNCGGCHNPKTGWTLPEDLSEGYPSTMYWRNIPTLINAGYYETWMRDGRIGGDFGTVIREHLSNPNLMQSDGRNMTVRQRSVKKYGSLYKKAFPGIQTRFGGQQVEVQYGHVLKALQQYVRSLTTTNTPFDRFLKGDRRALSPEARKGLALFKGKAGCIQCHNGALLSDGKPHNLGVPENPKMGTDPLLQISRRMQNRWMGVGNVTRIEEDYGWYMVTKQEKDKGKFRTTQLRYVAYTAPYMHNGMLGTLEDVVDFYSEGGGSHPNKSPLLKRLNLNPAEKAALVAFLESLSGPEIMQEDLKSEQNYPWELMPHPPDHRETGVLIIGGVKYPWPPQTDPETGEVVTLP